MKGVILVAFFHPGSRQAFVLFLYTDEVIDETYGVAVQFDEEEEEVIVNIKCGKNFC